MALVVPSALPGAVPRNLFTPCDGSFFLLGIQTDSFGYEIGWKITDDVTSNVVQQSQNPYLSNTAYVFLSETLAHKQLKTVLGKEG